MSFAFENLSSYLGQKLSASFSQTCLETSGPISVFRHQHSPEPAHFPLREVCHNREVAGLTAGASRVSKLGGWNPGRVAQLVGAQSVEAPSCTPKVVGLIPSQGTYRR